METHTKIAACFNTWDGCELLKHSIMSMINDIDLFIIIYQDVSNFGECYNPIDEINNAISIIEKHKCIIYKYNPISNNGFENEKNKRNIAIDIAKKNNCSHFINADNDELYKDFGLAKQLYFDSGFEGSVCSILTYFKHPTLCFDSLDGYYVPFIHKLTPNTTAGNANYPYYVDPTRRINCENVTLLPITMHHFSWVRKNIEQKCRNSSAKHNIERGTMLQSYYDINCKEGFYVKDYEKTLIKVADCFNLNSIFA